MAVFKYAFLMNSEALRPETHHGRIETDAIEASFYGVCSLDMAKETAAALSALGTDAIDLCGDFDENAAREIQEAVDDNTTIAFMKYLPEELAKLSALDSMGRYGIVIIDESFGDSINRILMHSDEFDTTIAAAGSVEKAGEAARTLVAEGIDFIELCSGFDENAAKEVIEQIGGAVPVGFAGDRA